MVVKVLACSLSLAVLGCLMVGCSDDTTRITSPGTTIQYDPLSTGVDETNNPSVDGYGDFIYYPYDTAAWNGSDDGLDDDDPMDLFDGDAGGSRKPIDNELGRG